ncbi:uncharacterized protein LOC112591544 [Melanaphis sacchari]|uniref:uncharacterized protein LOC112591544 n=1 Tax=Melanaphis sacchari TaxID=742174 RepID=UPI000DC14AB1|nr:uncharacterized protein LOC112591544 [Melanaphis sacchari]
MKKVKNQIVIPQYHSQYSSSFSEFDDSDKDISYAEPLKKPILSPSNSSIGFEIGNVDNNININQKKMNNEEIEAFQPLQTDSNQLMTIIESLVVKVDDLGKQIAGLRYDNRFLFDLVENIEKKKWKN